MKLAQDAESGVLDAVRRAGLDTVEGAFAYGGGTDLAKPGLGCRQRTFLKLEDSQGRTHRLYLKRYGREPLLTRLKRWATHGWGAGPAGVEFANVLAARAAGLPTMQGVACGEEPGFLGPARGCVILTAVPGDALSRTMEGFLRRHSHDDAAERLTLQLAKLVGAMHGSGYVHRDLYASHVFLDESQGDAALYLIDLARMFRPRWRRFRWLVKDLAQLKYSMPDAWNERWWETFLAAYLGGRSGRAFATFSRAVEGKAGRIRRRETGRRKSRG